MQIQISWLLQKPTDLDLHCLQRQGIYPGSAGQGLIILLEHHRKGSLIHTSELCHVKMYFHSYNADSKGPDLPAHLQSAKGIGLDKRGY